MPVTKSKKTKLHLFRWLENVWTFIIAIGASGYDTYWERKRVRLLNGISFCSILAYLGYMITYPLLIYKVVFLISALALVVNLLVIILNYYHRPDGACHLFCIFNLLFFSSLPLIHGPISEEVYYLMVSSVVPMLFFRELRIILTYFLLNLIGFLVGIYVYANIIPLFPIPAEHSNGGSNMILIFAFLFLIVYYFKSENSRQEKLLQIRNKKLEEEKQKSDDLLLNILPEEIAEELKENGTVKARSFNKVTVMFTGFKDFSLLCEKLPPDELVAEMNQYFSVFDKIISKYGIEKIKTIGDGYMCAGGLPEESDNNFNAVTKAALEIREYMSKMQTEKDISGYPVFEIRIGIHTGPVIAGIVGTKKFAYDVWGDTVNTASRMETGSEPGKINISKETFELIKNRFNCTYRGKLEAKNKGVVDMYFVEAES